MESSRHEILMYLGAMVSYTRPIEDQANQNSSMDEQETHKTSPLAEKRLTLYGY